MFAASRLKLPGAHASHGLPVAAKEKPDPHVQLPTLVLEASDSALSGHATHSNTAARASGEYCRIEYVFGLHGAHEDSSTRSVASLAPVVPSGQSAHAWLPP